MINPIKHMMILCFALWIFGGCHPPKPHVKKALTHQGKGNLLLPVQRIKMPPKAVRGGTLRRALFSRPKNYNWLLNVSEPILYFQHLAHDTLATQNSDNLAQWHQSLATHISRSSDYKVYTIKLRKGVYWQTPKHPKIHEDKYKWMAKKHELKAEDVKFLVDLIKNKTVKANALRQYYDDLDRVEVIDDFTLKIYWKKKTFTSVLATLSIYPMPKWLYSRFEDGTKIPELALGAVFNNHWASSYLVGTGPYEFQPHKKSNVIELVINPSYWGEKPFIEKIQSVIFKYTHIAIQQFEKGALDYMSVTAHAAKWINQLDTSPVHYERRWYDRSLYYFLAWNQRHHLFKDKSVRQAMTLAFDRQGAISTYFAKTVLLHNGPYPHKHAANHPDIKSWPYDLEAARTLLAQAGWRDDDKDGILERRINGEVKLFEFTMTTMRFDHFSQYLGMYQRALKKIGVVMHINLVSWSSYQQHLKTRKFEAFVGGWFVSENPDGYLLWHSSQANQPESFNYIGYANKVADGLIDALRVTFSTAKRLQLFRAFHKHLHDMQPYTFFYTSKAHLVSWPHVKHIEIQKARPHLSPRAWWIDQGSRR